MHTTSLLLILLLHLLPLVKSEACRYDIYAVGNDPLAQESCYPPRAPIGSYSLELNECLLVEGLPSDYRFKITAASDVHATEWGAAECFFKNNVVPTINPTSELDYCLLGTTFLYAMCWKETFDPNTTRSMSFVNTGTSSLQTTTKSGTIQSRLSSDSVTLTRSTLTTTMIDPSFSQITSFVKSSTSEFDYVTSREVSQTITNSVASTTVSAQNPSAEQGQAEGLQKEGNRIALGVGLGLGIPTLILTAIGLLSWTNKR